MKKRLRFATLILFVLMAAMPDAADCVDLWIEVGECQNDPDCGPSDASAIMADMLAGGCLPFF